MMLVASLTKLQWMVDMLRLKKRRWFLAGISALVSMACGWVIIPNPFQATDILWIFAAISLIAESMFDAIAIALGRKSNSAPQDAAENEDNDTE